MSIQVWSTIVAAAATVAIAILGFFQYRVMHLQRLAMEQQSQSMKSALIETKQSSDAATTSAQAATETLEAVREQTATAKDAAKAAADNAAAAKITAETLINTERAWMLFTEFFVVPGSSYPKRINFSFQNCGRTPAWVTELRWQFTKSKSVLRVPINYDVDVFTRAFPTLHDRVISSNKVMVQQVAELDRGNAITEDEEREIVAGDLLIHFFGILRYRDIFDKTRSSTFCLTWNYNRSGRWDFSGPPEANRCD